jgi:nicotinamide-nucleotide amidase
MSSELERLCRKVGSKLAQRQRLLATAESCTGGGVASGLTAISGSSEWFDSGYVTYSNAAKVAMLGVSEDTLQQHGAVSEPTAAEMARGAIASGRAHISCAITGIAGPAGGSAAKPVGTVCFGWAANDGRTLTRTRRFFGDRAAVREQSVRFALQGVLALLDDDADAG